VRKKEESSFCEQKEAKKTSFVASPPVVPPVREAPNEVFCALFFKKAPLLLTVALR
jgi:hypothetical protein